MEETKEKPPVPQAPKGPPALSQQEHAALLHFLKERMTVPSQEVDTVVILKQRLAALIQSNGKKKAPEAKAD